MNEHFKLKAAVMAIVSRNSGDSLELLLQQRSNTGFMDGFWDFAASGHLESSESLRQAMQRELREEIGIEVQLNDMMFSHLCHLTEAEMDVDYLNCYYWIREYQGVPSICEPEKCSALEWFCITDLPDTLIESRRDVLVKIMNESNYSEVGF